MHPGLVFDRTVDLARISQGYRAMEDREALKVLVRPRPASRRAPPGTVGRPT